MNILVIGNGGREHALAWKLAQSARADKVYVAPGNAGTALEDNLYNVDLKVTDIDGLITFAQKNSIEMTVVGPEVPLVAGIVDRFQEQDLRCFGPSQACAQLEGSKAFSKDFFARYGIPTAEYQVFTELDAATNYILQQTMPIVVKADGLAAGKGVVIAHTTQQAISAAGEMLSGQAFGIAGQQIVIEEFLQGEEASFFVIADGTTAVPLATSQDHKTRDEGDVGPNTGGMGAYSPAPVITPEINERVMREIIEPTLLGMQERGTPYTGFLYAGLMITDDGTPKLLEYNCRMGDPETQPVMMRLQSDLVDVLDAAIDSNLHQQSDLLWDDRAALGVVMVAGGYPGSYTQGNVISGLTEQSLDDIKIFHAGTRLEDNEVVTAGGRVLCVTALGASISQAGQKAYSAVDLIDWDHAYYRRDIGHRAIARADHTY
ncbi:MAG TPA: phosphoribosylamine--glycine ligase [Crenotrichaceae bacterium]|nr:phosphoribosylamine--glycine ligase [Crenotrichaceae bacterium]